MWTATTKPILLTARDVGAYEHLIILAQALNQSGVGTHLILQGAAQAQAAMTAPA